MNKNLVSLTALTAGLLSATNASAMIYEEDCNIALELYRRAAAECTSGIGGQECNLAMDSWVRDPSRSETYYDVWESTKLDIFECMRNQDVYNDTTFTECSRSYGWECTSNDACGSGEYYNNDQCILCPSGTYMNLSSHYITSCFNCPDSDYGDLKTEAGAKSTLDCYVDGDWEFEDLTGEGLQKFASGSCYYRFGS